MTDFVPEQAGHSVGLRPLLVQALKQNSPYKGSFLFLRKLKGNERNHKVSDSFCHSHNGNE